MPEDPELKKISQEVESEGEKGFKSFRKREPVAQKKLISVGKIAVQKAPIVVRAVPRPSGEQLRKAGEKIPLYELEKRRYEGEKARHFRPSSREDLRRIRIEKEEMSLAERRQTLLERERGISGRMPTAMEALERSASPLVHYAGAAGRAVNIPSPGGGSGSFVPDASGGRGVPGFLGDGVGPRMFLNEGSINIPGFVGPNSSQAQRGEPQQENIGVRVWRGMSGLQGGQFSMFSAPTKKVRGIGETVWDSTFSKRRRRFTW